MIFKFFHFLHPKHNKVSGVIINNYAIYKNNNSIM